MSEEYHQHLRPGARLDVYEIKEVLGEGGFGVTYRAWDTQLQLDVAIKEYLPAELATRARDQSTVVPRSASAEADYKYGLTRFLEEARTLARFREPNIVSVLRYLEANNTAYLVMEYAEGQTLREFIGHKRVLGEDELKSIFLPILDGLRVVHDEKILHRDIKPGNIYLRSNGVPMLIDFGAARQALGEQSRSMTGIVTAGYAPFEQYHTHGQSSPATDLYALGATLYRCITGEAPPEAPLRVEAIHDESPDPMRPAAQVGKGSYSPEFLETIDWMLAPLLKDRPKDVREVLARWLGEPATAEGQDAPATRKLGGGASATRRLGPAPGRQKPAAPAGRRRPAVVIGGVLGVLALAGAVAAAVLLWPASGSLRVLSTPAGAKWSLDGRAMGKTPGRAEDLAAGAHKVTIEREGYETWTEKFELEADQHKRIEAELAAQRYTLTVDTDPKGAKVEFLGGGHRYRAGMRLPTGTYRLRVSKAGYQAVERRVSISDRDVRLQVSLNKVGYSLTVRTEPANATVKILNIQPPYRDGMRLEPGRYHIQVSANGYKTKTGYVLLDEDKTVSVTLDPTGYTLTVNTVPRNATVKVLNIRPRYHDGMRLKPGRYHIQVSASGYQTKSNWIDLTSGSKTLTVRLERADAGVDALYRRAEAAYRRKDYRSAVVDYRKAAKLGHLPSMHSLGWLYQHGWGVPRDYKKALSWYRKAGQQGYAPSMYQTAIFYKEGRGTPKDLDTAFGWFRRAARKGDDDAMYYTGYFWENGWAFGKRDYGKARSWYLKAADKQNSAAYHRLGWIYQQGIGVAKDYNRALSWYRKGAAADNAGSMNQIGYLYDSGQGVPEDDRTGCHWYAKAARAGSITGMYNIGVCHETGEGVAQDRAKAIQWYRKAAAKGNDSAKKALRRLGAR